MPADIVVTGAEDFLRLSKALKAAGEGELRKQLNKDIKKAVGPVTKKTQAALADAVPFRLKARAGKTKQAVTTSTGRNPGVRILVRYGNRGTGLSAANAQLLNQGKGIRHPLFDDRERWYTTAVPDAQGWFDDTIMGEAPEIRRAVIGAMETIAQQIVRGL